jgi:prepilin-type N-terminal cleavage/methylation domain-containing protein
MVYSFTRAAQSGFTLVELAIVLVIIGLLIGGVLVGRDMIEAAAIRSTISQIDRYNTAAHAFQLKYDALPGDISSTQAQKLGFYYVSGSLANTIAAGNGDSILQGYNADPWTVGGTFGGEIAMFFLHLSQAHLIDGMYGAGGAHVTLEGATINGGSLADDIPGPTADATGIAVGELIPRAKLGNGNYFTIGSVDGRNYFVLSGINEIDSAKDVSSTNNLTPLQAYAIDEKMDDGKPGSGKVFALDAGNCAISTGGGCGITWPASNNCVNGSAYYTSDVYATIQNCSLRFDFQ